MCLPTQPYKIEREWIHAGLLCAVTQPRQAMNRCGYVRVPPTHPWHGKDYNDVDVSVHGGLTFGSLEPCVEHEDGQGWWFGFDCGHFNDLHYDPNVDVNDPSLDSASREVIQFYQEHPIALDCHYWTEAEVAAECERLAEQLAEVAVQTRPKIDLVAELARAKTRLEICMGRMRACQQKYPNQHQVSCQELPRWIREMEILLNDLRFNNGKD